MMSAMPLGDEPAVTVLPARPEPTAADEANHRIANSLQLLSALVSIEARGLGDGAGRAALDGIGRRISAVAGVHRLLCQTQAAGTVDLAVYLKRLGGSLTEAAGRAVVVDAHSVPVTAEQASAAGMIASELVANAGKYAYAAGEPGAVRIVLRAGRPGGYRLEVEDRGRGIARSAVADGLGTDIIHALALRLGGTCSYQDARPGTRFVLDVAA